MFKVYPQNEAPSSIFSNSSSTRDTFTIWFKSLILHGCGCTIFDSNGEVVYRMDNYDKKCRSQVYLLNLRGKVIFSLQRKKLHIFKHSNGFKGSGSYEGTTKSSKPWIQVKEDCKIFSRRMRTCHVTLGCDKNNKGNCYRIVGLPEKSEFQIIRGESELVAEVKRKKSSSGVALGDDVLSLVVEPQIDHLLIMAIVTVYGLISNKL